MVNAFSLRKVLKNRRARVRFPSPFIAKFFGQKCEVVRHNEFCNVSLERRSFIQR
jgi:hypothetical protein